MYLHTIRLNGDEFGDTAIALVACLHYTNVLRVIKFVRFDVGGKLCNYSSNFKNFVTNTYLTLKRTFKCTVYYINPVKIKRAVFSGRCANS